MKYAILDMFWSFNLNTFSIVLHNSLIVRRMFRMYASTSASINNNKQLYKTTIHLCSSFVYKLFSVYEVYIMFCLHDSK